MDRQHRVVVPKHGGPGVLEVIEEDVVTPAPGQISVRTLAAGVSAHDVMVRRASFPGFPKVPFTPGVDVVGVVEAVGSGVAAFDTGEVVGALLADEGGYAEHVCLPAADAVRVPVGVDPAEAACVVTNYLTAYAMLHRGAHVRSGERALVHGAAGGVGTALLDLGTLAGLELYGTASPYNHELVASLGAVPIDYHAEDFVARVHELTGDGVDVVFDPIGGWRQLWRSHRALRKGGRLVWFGVAATSRHGMRVIPASLAARFVIELIPDGRSAPMPPNGAEPNAWYRETLAVLFDYLARGKIHPIVADRIPLLEAARAHELLERGGYAGKVVLVGD
jgi:NADPH:quinone reductase